MLVSIRSFSTEGYLIFALFVVGVVLLRFLYRTFTDPLRDAPGPFLARFTRLWELQQFHKGHFEQVNIDLHKQHGPIVRIAPDRYSIDDPEAIKQIYGHGTKFVKSAFYHTFSSPDPQNYNLFALTNPERHSKERRKVASLYSMSTLVSYEQYVDSCNSVLCEQLQALTRNGELVNVPNWMQFYAFDVIGEISVGKPFGFMRAGNDFNDIIKILHNNIAFASRLSLFPELYPWIARAVHLLKIDVPVRKLDAYTYGHIASRRNGDDTTDRADFLSKLLELERVGKIEYNDVRATLSNNIVAGSDTTGVSLSATIFYLLRHPRCMEQLRQEIDENAAQGKLSDPITFHEAQKMPYLQAVIKESLRVHPATGQIFPRVVPPGGAQLAGKFFPEGVVVGTNSWVIHHNKEVFGPDAAEFRPERWLGPKDQVSIMEQFFFAFGSGAHTCIGKNVSLLEMSKLIPQLYRRFDFEFEPTREGQSSEWPEWTTENNWFVKQDFSCRVIPRMI